MAADPAAAVVFGMFFFILLMFAVMIGGLVFWIFMLIDCAKRKMPDNDKVVWILVLALTSYLGAIIYYFAVKRAAKK
jgi:hypothetical protein